MVYSSLPPFFFSGSSHHTLAQEIAQQYSCPLEHIDKELFPDGEFSITIGSSVKDRNVVVIQTLAPHPIEYLHELLYLIDAIHQGGPSSLTLMIPYLGYCRQNARETPTSSLGLNITASLLENSGIDSIVTIDPHISSFKDFFIIPIQTLPSPLWDKKIYHEKHLKDVTVVAADRSSVPRAQMLATSLHSPYAFVDKHISPSRLFGSVHRRSVLILDDICATGKTLAQAAELCIKGGASDVTAAVTHGVFTDGALATLSRSPITHIYASDTIAEHYDKRYPLPITRVATAPSLALSLQDTTILT
jgi:ribose-phosphate pyrophosphokinase